MLLKACMAKDAREVSRLLDQGADPNAVNPGPEQPFSALVLSLESPEIVDLLLKKGADPNRPDGSGLPPLSYVSESGQGVLEKLVSAGADTRRISDDGGTLMHIAADSQNVNLAEFCVAHGLSVNDRDNHGLTPLHRAVMAPLPRSKTSQLTIIKWLLAHGADRTIKDKTGYTPYFYAAKKFALSRPQGAQIKALLGP